MKRIFFYASMLISSMALCACGGNDDGPSTPDGPQLEGELPAATPTKTNTMTVMAHYMPWFESPATTSDKSWGWHWTMGRPGNYNVAAGEIASHYHPLAGPYATNDATHLDYQCLLMKYSGIDGMIIDWIGIGERNDFPAVHTNTLATVSACQRNGLKFAICYDEQTALADGVIKDTYDKRVQATADMGFVARTFFTKPNYATANGRPLLLFFGPSGLKSPADWKKALAAVSNAEICVLKGHSSAMNDGADRLTTSEFEWVNPKPDYSAAAQYSLYIANAMPGFHDYYREGGQGNGYTTYNDEGGALFDRQLQAARQSGLQWLQLTTWNDYGEGTIIEPTREFEYRYLTKLQTFTGVDHGNEANLRLVARWYDLTTHDNGAHKAVLQQAYYHLRAMQPEKAKALIEAL